MLQAMRLNDVVLPTIPHELIEAFAYETSSFVVDGPLYLVIFFKNRLKMACLTRQQYSLYEKVYTDEKLNALFNEMFAVNHFHESVDFTRHIADIVYINTRFCEQIKVIVSLLEEERKSKDIEVSSFLHSLVTEKKTDYGLTCYPSRLYQRGTDALNAVKQDEKDASRSLCIDLYFAYVRLPKYKDIEHFKITQVSQFSSNERYPTLFVCFDEDIFYSPQPKFFAVAEQKEEIDLCRLWPLSLAYDAQYQHGLVSKSKMYVVRNYPRSLYERFESAGDDTLSQYRVICANAREIMLNQCMLDHFDRVLELFTYAAHVTRRKKKEERTRQFMQDRLLVEEQLRNNEELKRAQFGEFFNHMEEVLKYGSMATSFQNRTRHYTRWQPEEDDDEDDIPNLVPYDHTLREEAKRKATRLEKLVWLKEKGVVEDFGVDENNQLSIKLAVPHVKNRLSVINYLNGFCESLDI